MLVQVLTEAPKAIKTMMEQDVLFAVMCVIVVVLATAVIWLGKRYVKKLEDDGKLKEKVDEILTILNNRK